MSKRAIEWFAFLGLSVASLIAIIAKPGSPAVLITVAIWASVIIVRAAWLKKTGLGGVFALQIVFIAVVASTISNMADESQMDRLRKASPVAYAAELAARSDATSDQNKKIDLLREAASIDASHKAKLDEQTNKLHWAQQAEAAAKRLVEANAAKAEAARIRRETAVTVELVRWSVGGFGVVMLLDAKIKNDLDVAIKDVSIRCALSGESGTALSTVQKTVYKTVPARGALSVKQLNMGLIDGQSARADCGVVNYLDR